MPTEVLKKFTRKFVASYQTMNCSSVTLTGAKCKKKAVQDGKCLAHLSQTCAVCLEEIRRNTAKKLKCKHAFHNKCIMTWFETSIECPQCRMEQDDDPIIVFRKHVEENMREKYREAIRSLEAEVMRARRSR
ncbi:hypothetical protein EBT31_18775 [bacterium]|nr:hypothetical protein [bacterium]